MGIVGTSLPRPALRLLCRALTALGLCSLDGYTPFLEEPGPDGPTLHLPGPLDLSISARS